MREFHIGEILSITTGKLVSPKHIGGVYEILDYMTGDSLFTHQLPRVAEECKPYLLKQHVWLKDITGEEVTTENWKEWLENIIKKHGETLPVEPLPEGKHVSKNALLELFEMVGKAEESDVIGYQRNS